MKSTVIAALVFALIAFTAQASNKPAIRIAYFDNYAPYSWLDDDGEMRGVFIDILDEVIGKRMGVPVQHTGLPWARAQQYVKAGEQDALIAPVTAARRDYANVSRQPVLNSRMALFTDALHPRMADLQQTRSLTDINSFSFVTQLGDGWAAENLPDNKVQYVTDLNAVLRVLSVGRADLFIESSLVAHWNLRKLGLSGNVVEVEGVTIEQTPYHLLISKQSNLQILDEFDRHMLAFIQSGDLERLLQRYR